jgi:hypothetical protein
MSLVESPYVQHIFQQNFLKLTHFRSFCTSHHTTYVSTDTVITIHFELFIEFIGLWRWCTNTTIKKSSNPRNRPRRPTGLWDVKDPRLSRQSAQKAARLSALRTGNDLLPTNINFFLLVIISVTSWAISGAGMKDYVNWISINFTGSRTRDLPAASIEPYPLSYRAPIVCVCVCVCVCARAR